MEFLDLHIADEVAHVRLNRGRSNALHTPMIRELTDLLGQLDADPAIRGIMLHGKEGFFSAGLDLVELYQYDDAQIRDLWVRFIGLVLTFLEVGKPTVAAITGHSPAGGCVLALCCDHRVMAEGDYIIGLNELPVGIIVPQAIFHLYAFWIGQAKAYRYLLEGKLLSTQEAKDCGLVDEVVAGDRLVSTAERQMRKFLQFDPVSWRNSKLNLRQGLLAEFNADHTEAIDTILAQWWTPSTRSLLQSIIDNLKSKK